jgi:prevent-host-death family protein
VVGRKLSRVVERKAIPGSREEHTPNALALIANYQSIGYVVIDNAGGEKMRFVSVRELNTKPKEIWKKVTEGEVVVTSNGKPVALLSPVTEENLEKTLRAIRRSRSLMSLEELQSRSLESGLDRLTDSEIDSEIKRVRKNRKA